MVEYTKEAAVNFHIEETVEYLKANSFKQ